LSALTEVLARPRLRQHPIGAEITLCTTESVTFGLNAATVVEDTY